MKQNDEFERYAAALKQIHDIVAVCRAKHGHEELFSIPFETEGQLEDFLRRNDGDVHQKGFYAKGFVNGEYVGENT